MLRNIDGTKNEDGGNFCTRATTWKLERGTLVKAMAEFLGTGLLLFITCLTNVGSMSVYPPPERMTAFNSGLVVNAIIMMLGHISGAYINPAMTIGAILCGCRSIPTGIVLIIAEMLGGVLGFGLLVLVTPTDLWHTGYPDTSTGVCLTLVYSGLSTWQGLVVEFVCTVVLMMVNCAAWDPRNSHNSDSTSLRIGFTVTALSLAGVHYTGCSMNPIRSFAPALWNNVWTGHWVYWLGPCSGAVVGTIVYAVVLKDRSLGKEDSILEGRRGYKSVDNGLQLSIWES